MSITRLGFSRRLSQSSLYGSYPTGFVYDADAERYLAAVEAADGTALEYGVRQAVAKFVAGCKTDGNWTPIKASCILCGARTLSGALVPLVGTAPTNANFVSGDYSRTTGLLGNGSTKWLNSNRNNNADPQNSHHVAVYVSASGGSDRVYIGAGAGTNETGATNLGPTGTGIFARSRNSSAATGGSTQAGFIGVSRDSSTAYTRRLGRATTTVTLTSQSPANASIGVFSASTGTFAAPARLAFYSIGEAVTLSTLETRVQALYDAIAAALA